MIGLWRLAQTMVVHLHPHPCSEFCIQTHPDLHLASCFKGSKCRCQVLTTTYLERSSATSKFILWIVHCPGRSGGILLHINTKVFPSLLDLQAAPHPNAASWSSSFPTRSVILPLVSDLVLKALVLHQKQAMVAKIVLNGNDSSDVLSTRLIARDVCNAFCALCWALYWASAMANQRDLEATGNGRPSWPAEDVQCPQRSDSRDTNYMGARSVLITCYRSAF